MSEIPEPTLKPNYDFVVAGAGMAGALAAARLSQAFPGAAIAILEKDGVPGGRIAVGAGARWGFGLNAISSDLRDFIVNTASILDAERTLVLDAAPEPDTIGFLQAGGIHPVLRDEFYSAKGLRVFGAKKTGPELDQVAAFFQSDVASGAGTLAKRLTLPKRSPTVPALEKWGLVHGIPDVWQSDPLGLAQRADFYRTMCRGNWESAIEYLIEGRAELATRCRIVEADFAGGVWQLRTESGNTSTPALVVAQSPWDVLKWMPRKMIPSEVQVIGLKTQPVSLVVMGEEYEEPLDLPIRTFVPGESLQVVRNGTRLYYQATIDYEQSLDAPEVSKAVRRLRRARDKLAPWLGTKKRVREHISLLPTAWAQTTVAGDRRYQAKLEMKTINTKSLAFCGDAYGQWYHPDLNLIRSLLDMNEVFKT